MRRTVATTCSLVLLLAGCGLDAQSAPEPVALPSAEPSADPSVRAGQQELRVYLVSGDRLAPAERRVPDRTLESALAALAAGPTPAEVVQGKRTAVAPQVFTAVTSDVARGVAVVQATDQLSAVAGENQLLAVAQLVWTVTEVPGIRLVRFAVEGEPVEVPTDRGLVGYPVGRSAYASVRPQS